ncbi:hypothetical protein GOP47_0005565 [Adiantum capillus-veneris]|uniref:C3H1-type domain-containing protein n=1 Tax=Adiantum capillus-veneris TaxID=13818 RepID=A0A9D4V5B5_ADICA|nr:hypothetical protein GOP47_0005565 [Adiantum capillus-veneris]
MNRTPVCRDFLRGSCRFGSRCKFSHNTSQQQRQQSSNPFGFGAKNQGQQQPKGGNYYSPVASQRQDKNQSQVAVKEHRCNDPKECKQQIKEDLEHELPAFWRLTCYAHGKFLPNDIAGDVSFEELRAHAYAVGKQGMPIDSVVQNERNMFNAKKKEFGFLLNNPYSGPASSGSSGSFTNSPLQQEASKMSFATITPVFSSSPFPTSNSLAGSTGPLSGFGDVKESGGFSFGLGAPSGTANVVTASNPLSPLTPPAPGFSFGARTSDPGPSMQGSFPQNAFSSSPQLVSGFGQSSFNFNPPIGNPSPAPHNLFWEGNPFQAAKETEMSDSVVPLNQQNLGVKGTENPMTQMVAGLTSHTNYTSFSSSRPAAPFSQQNEDTKADVWLKANWDLGEVPEEEPPLYARYKIAGCGC